MKSLSNYPTLSNIMLASLDSFMKEFQDNTSVPTYGKKNDRYWGEVLVNLHQDEEDAEVVYIEWIQVVETKQGQGTKFMNWITELADKHQVALRLEPRSVARKSPEQKKLEDFYHRFGFEWEYGPQTVMLRKPR